MEDCAAHVSCDCQSDGLRLWGWGVGGLPHPMNATLRSGAIV